MNRKGIPVSGSFRFEFIPADPASQWDMPKNVLPKWTLKKHIAYQQSFTVLGVFFLVFFGFLVLFIFTGGLQKSKSLFRSHAASRDESVPHRRLLPLSFGERRASRARRRWRSWCWAPGVQEADLPRVETEGKGSCGPARPPKWGSTSQGSLKDTFCPFETCCFFHQNKGKAPFTRQCSGV